MEAVLVTADDSQGALRSLLAEWHTQAADLWELTAKIGAKLVEEYEHLADEDWIPWLSTIGLRPFEAFVFMRATRYPELVQANPPESPAAIARLLPQGQGTAFDAEQAALARRLHDAGMTEPKLRGLMGCSKNTLLRWLDPNEYARKAQQQVDADRLRRNAVTEERERRRNAALKAKGGPSALAASHVQVAVSALDEEWRTTKDPERHRVLGAAIDALYKAKDKLMLAEGIR